MSPAPEPQSSGDTKKAKRRIRRAVLEVRDALEAAHRDAAAGEVADLVTSIVRDRRADAVMAFWAFGSELPTDLLIGRLAADGVRVYLPRIVDGELQALEYRPGDPTVATSFGAREPAHGALAAPEELDVILVPAVAFDAQGYRVGYGGGFYDRFLPRTRPDALRVGIGLAAQRVERVPRAPFDVPVDLVVTEEGIDPVGRNGART